MAQLKVIAPPEQSRVARLVDDYLASKRAQGLSPKSVEQYAYALRRVFLPFLVAEGITEPEKLTTRLMERLSARLLTEGGPRGPLSKDSVHSYLRPVRWFINWVNADPESATAIKAKVPLPRLPTRRILEVLSADELNALRTAARGRSRRDELIVDLLMETGIRNSELTQLRPGDLHRRDKGYYLLVQGKGDRQRLVPLDGRLFRALETYTEAQAKRTGDPGGTIFRSERRRPGSGEQESLQRTGIEQLVRTLAREAGITRRVYPHLLRHSFATHYLQAGGSALILKDVLGHTDLTMIERHYGHLTHVDAYEEMLRLRKVK